MTYDLYFNGHNVGFAQCSREGLYNIIYCKCKLPKVGLMKIEVSSNGTQLVKGTLLHDGEYFVFRTKIPSKKVRCDQLEFRLVPVNESFIAESISVSAEYPFPRLEEIENAYLIQNGNTYKVAFYSTDKSISRPTGQ